MSNATGESSGGVRTSRGQRTDEFQAKAETAAGANNRGQPRRSGGIKFNLQQIPWIQQDSGVQHHAPFTHFRASALDHSGGKAFGGYDANGHINGQARPATGGVGIRHLAHHRAGSCFLQITKVKCSWDQWYGGRRYWKRRVQWHAGGDTPLVIFSLLS